MHSLSLTATMITLMLCSFVLRRISVPRFLIAGCGGLVLATLVSIRAFPFLREDTILAGGRLVPTTQWAAAMGIFLYLGSALFLLIGLIPFVVALAGKHFRRPSETATGQRPNPSLEPTAGRRDKHI